MRTAPIAVAAVLALAATAAEAQLFKCVQGGRTVYQDSPCDDAARQSTVRAPTPAPAPAPSEAQGAAQAAPAAASRGGGGGNALDVVAGFSICSERVPNFQRKYTDAYEGWKMRNAAAVSRLSNEPDASQLDARMRDERARPAEESIAERCADVATTIQPPREAGLPKVVQ
jgi:Domain of unknown function (DUF4124)